MADRERLQERRQRLSSISWLMRWTGRQTRPDKRDQIPAELLPILERLRLSNETWVETVLNFGRWFRLAAGRVDSLAAEAARRGRRWLQGVSREQSEPPIRETQPIRPAPAVEHRPKSLHDQLARSARNRDAGSRVRPASFSVLRLRPKAPLRSRPSAALPGPPRRTPLRRPPPQPRGRTRPGTGIGRPGSPAADPRQRPAAQTAVRHRPFCPES